MQAYVIGAMLAHQGGWDEGLIVAGPLLVIVGLLWLAKRRASALEHERPAEGQSPISGE
jgi:hypothetical protein